ncbi:flagellar biosynthesis protein FliR [Novosphingobium sp. Rr 2-17]|uniref:flagellar biosynthetic protein FliR n=1 Tax=Novosphingobium sp. Rr 2-17 TaxID=555793 RepID=UPI000269921F|nr:flagellar biosynthetic protein FliR [Novosphingobium sp. Rr 2-17]EIZ78713.1 flagellar biosynthesis protein FliR [Novosphingobium sp. Rr 2-17]
MEALPGEVTRFLILFARVGSVLMLLPVFSEDAVPPKIRLMMGLGMSAGLWGLIGSRIAPVAADSAALPGIIIAEILTGLAIGMIIKIMFLAAAMAGSIISLQIGLSSALINDSAQGGQAAVLSKLVSVAAVVVCMGMGLHHQWIAAIVHSYAMFPVGALPPSADFAQLAILTIGKAMSLSITLAAPLLVYGTVFNLALGLSTRLAPAIQVFFLVQPLNLLLGLALFASLIGGILTAFSTALSLWLQAGWV